MKYIITTIIIAVFSFGLSAQEKELVVPFSKPSDAKKLAINIMSGTIQVRGTDRDDVLIKYEIQEKAEDDFPEKEDEKSQGMKKIGGGNFEFEIGENNNKVYVRSQNWMNNMRLEIEVPKEIMVDISKQMGENVMIENISGDVNVENNIGSVEIKGVNGAVNASSVAGEIKVEFDKIDPEQNMTFNTITGSIDLTLPPDYKANLKMRTQWGDIFSDLDVTTKPMQGEQVKNEDGNGMKIVSNNYTYGELNGGGPEMTIKTQMGSIYLRAK